MSDIQLFNKDCIKGMAELAEHSVGLILADPPYYRVKGDFDFKWSFGEEYLAEAEQWALAMKRVLAHNGTLIWFCSYQMVADLVALTGTGDRQEG